MPAPDRAQRARTQPEGRSYHVPYWGSGMGVRSRIRLGGVVILVALPRVTVLAQEVELVPNFFHLPSQDDISAISMDCDGTPPFTRMHCRFTQLAVSRPGPSDGKSHQEALAELERMPWPELRAMRDDMCKNLDTNLGSDQQLLPNDGSQKAATRARTIAMVKQLCQCTEATCARRELSSYVALARETCKVWMNSYEADFKRASTMRRWVSDSTPYGSCKSYCQVLWIGPA